MPEDAITSAIASAAAGLEASSATTSAESAAASAPAGDGTTPGGTAVDTGDGLTHTVDASADQPVGEDGLPVDPAAAAKPRGPIPYDRHQAVLTKARREFEAQLQTAKSDAARQLDALKWAQQPGAQDRLRAIELAESNPDLFLQVLKQDQRYAKLLSAQQAERVEPPAASHDMPQPDLQAPDGTLLYSKERQDQLLAWQERKLEEKFKKSLDERFQPLDQAQRVQQMWGEALERQKSKLAHARQSWHMYGDLEPKIRQRLAADQKLSLEEAYIQELVPALVANRDDMYKRVLAEINAAKPAASQPKPGVAAAPPASSQPRSMEDEIAAIAARLERTSAAA